jgi:HlyD family secretion protein
MARLSLYRGKEPRHTEEACMSKFLPWISLMVLLALPMTQWWSESPSHPSVEHCFGTGRIVTKVVLMLTPQAGRLARLLVNDGDAVTIGQVVARLDSSALEEALNQAKGELLQAQARAEAIKEQMEQQSDMQSTPLQLSSRQEDVALLQSKQAALQDKVVSLRSQLFDAQTAVIAAHNTIERLHTEIAACSVTSPIPGVVLHHLAQEGEPLISDAILLQLIDLREVFMQFSLPADMAARIAIGAEVRLMLDLPTSIVLPAQVALIAPAEHNFTHLWTFWGPQSQTQQEVLAKIAPEVVTTLLSGQIIEGVSGRAYVRIDRNSPWPESLRVSHPEEMPGNHNWKNPVMPISTYSIH